jgi:alkanesulfonate monooxygenase SsuD/methylene tetrahydromethanopterin reductase-like flavin-dependent oxidoreductase (luciferase family)
MIGAFAKRMLGLTAKYADKWNTGYLGFPDTLDAPRQEMLAACQESDRDPATLGVTAMLSLHYPDLAPEGGNFDNPPLTGSAEEVAQAMLGYEKKGVEHIMFHLIPYKLSAIGRLEEALRIYRQISGGKA